MRFRDNYYFLSNMFPSTITTTVGGVRYTFTCVEAAFQAMKCPERAHEFVGIDGYAAKRLGRKVPLRCDWESIKIRVMYELVKAKFHQNPELLARLKQVTGEIVEDNTWNDKFWGRCNGEGQNQLGRILMLVRDKT